MVTQLGTLKKVSTWYRYKFQQPNGLSLSKKIRLKERKELDDFI